MGNKITEKEPKFKIGDHVSFKTMFRHDLSKTQIEGTVKGYIVSIEFMSIPRDQVYLYGISKDMDVSTTGYSKPKESFGKMQENELELIS